MDYGWNLMEKILYSIPLQTKSGGGFMWKHLIAVKFNHSIWDGPEIRMFSLFIVLVFVVFWTVNKLNLIQYNTIYSYIDKGIFSLVNNHHKQNTNE